MAKEVVYDCLLLEFYEKKFNKPLLLLSGEQVSIRKYFGRIQAPEYGLNQFVHSTGIVDIHTIIEIGQGKLVLAGRNFGLSIGEFEQYSFDFYFCSCDEEEIYKIIDNVKRAINWTYVRSEKYVQFIALLFDRFILNFHLHIYTDEQDIIQNMPDSSYKHYYTVFGYYCTIVAGLIKSIDRCGYGELMTLSDLYDDRNHQDITTSIYKNYLEVVRISNKELNYDISSVIFWFWFKLCVVDAKNRLVPKRSSRIPIFA